MKCRIEFSDSSVIQIPAVEDSWYWQDLFETLLEMGEITQSQYEEAEEFLDFDGKVEQSVSFRVKKPKPGLKRVERKTKSGLKRIDKKTKSGLTPKKNLIPKPSQIPTAKATGKLKNKVSPSNPAIVNYLTYSMPLKCSIDGSDWTATLVSTHKPTKSELKSSKSSKGILGGRIHLVLDDSGSMYGEPMEQLKKATIYFLSERSERENIILHTINGSLSGSGSPSSKGSNSVSSVVENLSGGGGTPMCRCLERVSESVTNGDVIIFFSDGGSTDGNPTNIANIIKGKNIRFITIGCGSNVDKTLMLSMASSKADFHYANRATGILQAFQTVSKSLGQQRIAHSSLGDKSGSTIVARQVQSQGDSVTSSSSNSGYVSSSVLADNEGFEFIEEFNCHHCSSTERVACGYCGKNMCSGGSRNVKGAFSTIICPYCNEVSEIETTNKGVHAGVGRLGGKKGK